MHQVLTTWLAKVPHNDVMALDHSFYRALFWRYWQTWKGAFAFESVKNLHKKVLLNIQEFQETRL